MQTCTRTYHLHCGMLNGGLNQFDKFNSYCAQHCPQSIVPPDPAPSCPHCNTSVSDDWIQCPIPSCAIGLHRDCVQERANQKLERCPGCGNHDQYLAEMVFFGIWYQNDNE